MQAALPNSAAALLISKRSCFDLAGDIPVTAADTAVAPRPGWNDYVHWCNEEHRHSGISLLTPALHDGLARSVSKSARPFSTTPISFKLIGPFALYIATGSGGRKSRINGREWRDSNAARFSRSRAKAWRIPAAR